MTRRVAIAILMLLLATSATANAKPVPMKPPTQVRIGRASLGRTATGHPSILVQTASQVPALAG